MKKDFDKAIELYEKCIELDKQCKSCREEKSNCNPNQEANDYSLQTKNTNHY